MTVVADFVAPARVEVASQESVDALISNIRFSAKTEQDRLEMFQLATEVRNTQCYPDVVQFSQHQLGGRCKFD